MKTVVKEGQTLADVGVETKGSWEAAVGLAVENGLSVTDEPEGGTELRLPDRTYDRTLELYCKREAVSPATARDEYGGRTGVFGDECQAEFE